MSWLVPAFVAAVLLHLTDRPPMLAARLGDRFANVLAVLAGLAMAHGIAVALAAIFATAIQPMMPPDARTLLIGVALILAGLAGLFRARALDGLEAWRTGAFTTALLGGFNLIWGDRAYFMTFALAVAAPMPWAAALGGWLGGVVIAFAAMAVGTEGWARMPIRWLRPVVAVLALGIGGLLTFCAIG